MITNNEFNIKATGRIAVITEKQVEQAHNNHLALYSGFMMDKSKAIECIAKALYEHEYGRSRPLWEDEDNGYKEIYLKRAEAALNALLEVKK